MECPKYESKAYIVTIIRGTTVASAEIAAASLLLLKSPTTRYKEQTPPAEKYRWRGAGLIGWTRNRIFLFFDSLSLYFEHERLQIFAKTFCRKIKNGISTELLKV